MARAVCLAMLCGFATPAIASPRSDPTTGRAVFTGATVAGAPAIELNPAALGLSSIDEIYLAATAVLDRYAIDRQKLELDTAALSPAGSVHDLEMTPGGTAAAVLHLKDRGAIAVMIHSAPAEVFPDGEPLRYHELGGRRRTYAGTFAAQIKITNEVLFGASLALQTTYLKLRYARDTALEAGHGANGVDSDCNGAPCGTENLAATERYAVNVHSKLFSADALAVNLGLVIQLSKETFVGLAYHTPPGLAVQNEMTGTMEVTRAPRDGGNIVRGGATVNISNPASVDAELRTRVGPQLDLHVGARWEDLSRDRAFDVRGYGSTFPSAGVPEWTERPRGFHDPLAMWAGVEQVDLGETWRLGARLGFETSSVPDEKTSALTIAPHSLTADVGAQYRIANVIVQLSYGFQYFTTVNVRNSAFDPRARIACIDSGYDYSTAACESVRLGYAIATAAGDYSRMEHAVRLGLRILLGSQ